VSKARFALFGLICACAVILLFDGFIALGLVAAALAVGLAITAFALRPRETEFLWSVIWLPAPLAVLPALWMVIQILPLPPLAHPFWASAAAALGHPIAGSISIDTGASIVALGQYLSVVALGLLSAAVCVDRRRAGSILLVLTGACAAIGLLPVLHALLPAAVALEPHVLVQATTCAGMGTIIASSGCMRAIERQGTIDSLRPESALVAPRTLAFCGAALAICVIALALDPTVNSIFAWGCGAAVLIFVFIVRRFKLGILAIAAFAVLVSGFVILIATSHSSQAGGKLSLAFAASSPDLLVLSERVLADSPLAGTGAGTFAAIEPIYRELGSPQPGSTAPTTAASIAIELGQAMLWFVVLVTAVSVIALIRASLQRGRDWFYAAMGAGCLLTLLLLAFVNPGLMGTAPALILAAVVGLAVAQSKSRRMQSNASPASHDAPRYIKFRVVMMLFAVLLGAEAVWLLLPEYYQVGIYQVPTDAAAAAKAAKQRPDAALAARTAAVRGDLWGEYAYTYANLLWSNGTSDSDLPKSLNLAWSSIEDALEYAPEQPGAWLLLAGLGRAPALQSADRLNALKMSYYTGPSEHELASLRLWIAARLMDSSDAELQQMMRRDLRLLVSSHETAAIASAYADAPAAGKRFIEQSLNELDPSALGSLSATTPKAH
jgi:hypothetical protein